MEKPIKTIVNPVDGRRIEIRFDEFPISPREWARSKLCIRNNRKYVFPNELGYSFGDAELEKGKVYGKWVFPISFYEHSGIAFSLGTQTDSFDGVNSVGFIAFEKEDFSERDALAQAETEISLFNSYINGEVYAYHVFEPDDTIEKDGKVFTHNGDCVYSCGGFFSMDEIEDEIESQFNS